MCPGLEKLFVLQNISFPTELTMLVTGEVLTLQIKQTPIKMTFLSLLTESWVRLRIQTKTKFQNGDPEGLKVVRGYVKG
jgi:hypothetical protein